MNRETRIGIFGGTFNPVHRGHIEIVRNALEEGLSRVMVIPCWLSPHKLDQANAPAMVSGEHRHAMLQKVFNDEPRVEVSRIEIDCAEPSYTWKTLERLRAEHGAFTPVLIVGWDQFCVLDTWTRFSDWGESVEYLVFRRPDNKSVSEPSATVRKLIHRISEKAIPSISSTQVRNAVGAGHVVEEMVPASVLDYIHNNWLYR